MDRKHKKFTLPLSANTQVKFSGPFPLTEEEWNLMLAELNACKPGLILPPPMILNLGLSADSLEMTIPQGFTKTAATLPPRA